MLVLGLMPIARSGGPDRFGQIWCCLGFLLLFLLLQRLELGGSVRASVSFNKVVARGHCLVVLGRSARKLPPTGRGGEWKKWKDASISASCRRGGGLGASQGEGHLSLDGLGGEGRTTFSALLGAAGKSSNQKWGFELLLRARHGGVDDYGFHAPAAGSWFMYQGNSNASPGSALMAASSPSFLMVVC